MITNSAFRMRNPPAYCLYRQLQHAARFFNLLSSFSHMRFLIKETNVSRSIHTCQNKNTASTAALSALYFLITGKDFAEAETKEDKKVKEARKCCCSCLYKRNRLADFSVRKAELVIKPHQDAITLQERVEAVLDDIVKIENAIAESIKHNKQLLKEILIQMHSCLNATPCIIVLISRLGASMPLT